MTIQATMLSVESVPISEVSFYAVSITANGPPGESYRVFNPTINAYEVFPPNNPSYEGQLILYKDSASTDQIASLYVAVNIATTGVQLEWVRCISSPNFFNPNTGTAFDPLAPHYNPLAS
jgi:hypothetical protein